MIKNLVINGLRGISQCKIDDMGSVNLFLGHNNCGKSTILEALFLLTGGTFPINFLRINKLRNFLLKEGEDLRLSFYGAQKDSPIVIEGCFDFGNRKLTITYSEDVIEKVSVKQIPDDINKPLPKDSQIKFDLLLENEKHVETQLEVRHQQPQKLNIKGDTNHEGHILACFISPSEFFNSVENSFAEIIVNKQEEFVVEILRQIEPSIQDIVLAGNQILLDVGFEKRIPIQLLGDGLKKVLSIVVNMAMVKNGILLVDEIDNGLHYSSMPILWDAVIKSANMYNVQVFATTHNIESLRALNDVLANDEYYNIQEKFRSYTIRRVDDGFHKLIMSKYPQFNHIINQNMELR